MQASQIHVRTEISPRLSPQQIRRRVKFIQNGTDPAEQERLRAVSQTLHQGLGASVSLPMHEPGEQLVSAFQNMSPENREKAVQLGHTFYHSALSIMNEYGNQLNIGSEGDVPAELLSLVGQQAQSYSAFNGSESVYSENVLAAMQGGIAASQQSLFELANEMQAMNRIKAEMRVDMTELKELMNAGEYPVDYSYTDAEGNIVDVSIGSEEEAQTLLESLELTGETMGEMTQEMQWKIQQFVQMNTQFMNMLSNVMKAGHDAQMSAVNNTRS